MVFKGLDMSNTTITALVGIINFLATLVGLGFLACFGRKTIMLVFNAAMALTILLLSYYSFEHNSTGMIVCVLLFIAFFEFSSGPIVWLYMAEIMQDKALSIGAFLNWFLSLVVSITIPLILRQVAIGYIFLFFGICTVFGTLFIIFFMEETRGKSQAEIDRLYSKEVDNDYQKE
jgi:MFS family permease